MALQAAYKQFLAAPNSSFLASNASLHYVTTTTSFNGATEIIKHLGTLRNQVRKKKEEFLDVVEGQNTLIVQVDTALVFQTSGGVYLPALDDNFLSDREVFFPIFHVVTFDGEGKVTQIRQSWDQGSLLKQLDVIGKTGRNWPIRDSRDQLKLITACLRSSGAVALEGSDPNEKIQRSRGNSTNVLRDPHASLHETLFAPREEIEQSAAAAVISPRAGSRPPQRTFTDILGDQDEDGAGSGAPSGRERSQSPSKPIAPKIGAGKNFQPMRLFETEEEGSPATSGKQPGGDPSTPERSRPTERFYRPNPKKYNHFDFADGSDPQDTPKPGVAWEARPKSKHDSTWSFEDFVTPQKTTSTKTLQHHTRHWVAGDEDPAGGAENVAPSGVQRKPRRDAETHFEFRDDGEPPRGDAAQRLPRRPRGAAHNEGLGLYENHVQTPEEDAAAAPADHRPLGNITNLKDRGRDFDAHFVMTDDASAVPGQPARPISEDRMKAVRMMDANWSAYDHSPGPPPASMKENGNGSAGPAKPVRSGGAPRDTGISIAGDGMGSRKGGRGWSIGDESDDEKAAAPVPAKKPGVNKNASSFWDF